MTTYVYFHGFNSAFTLDNPKVAELAAIGTVVGVTYDSLADHSTIRDSLLKQLPDDLTDVVLVGTSLGAYWAGEIARLLGLPSVLINPSIIPGVSLSKYVGQSFTNYVTGDTGFFGRDTFATYLGAMFRPGRVLPLVAVDLADEVIPAADTVKFFAAHGIDTVTFAGGSHKFDHMADLLPMVSAYANHTSYLP